MYRILMLILLLINVVNADLSGKTAITDTATVSGINAIVANLLDTNVSWTLKKSKTLTANLTIPKTQEFSIADGVRINLGGYTLRIKNGGKFGDSSIVGSGIVIFDTCAVEEFHSKWIGSSAISCTLKTCSRDTVKVTTFQTSTAGIGAANITNCTSDSSNSRIYVGTLKGKADSAQSVNGFDTVAKGWRYYCWNRQSYDSVKALIGSTSRADIFLGDTLSIHMDTVFELHTLHITRKGFISNLNGYDTLRVFGKIAVESGGRIYGDSLMPLFSKASGGITIYPEQFGAIKEQVNFDNAIPINKALRSITAGGTVKLLAGKYYVTTPIIPMINSTSLKGSGKNSTTLWPNSAFTGGAVIRKVNNGTYSDGSMRYFFELSDMQIYNNYDGVLRNVWFESSSTAGGIAESKIHDVYFVDYSPSRALHAHIYWKYTWLNTIYNCDFIEGGYGIYLSGVNNKDIIRDNFFSTQRRAKIYSAQSVKLIIDGNYFEHGGQTSPCIFFTDWTRCPTVTNNGAEVNYDFIMWSGANTDTSEVYPVVNGFITQMECSNNRYYTTGGHFFYSIDGQSMLHASFSNNEITYGQAGPIPSGIPRSGDTLRIVDIKTNTASYLDVNFRNNHVYDGSNAEVLAGQQWMAVRPPFNNMVKKQNYLCNSCWVIGDTNLVFGTAGDVEISSSEGDLTTDFPGVTNFYSNGNINVESIDNNINIQSDDSAVNIQAGTNVNVYADTTIITGELKVSGEVLGNASTSTTSDSARVTYSVNGGPIVATTAVLSGNVDVNARITTRMLVGAEGSCTGSSLTKDLSVSPRMFYTTFGDYQWTFVNCPVGTVIYVYNPSGTVSIGLDSQNNNKYISIPAGHAAQLLCVSASTYYLWDAWLTTKSYLDN